MKLKIQFLLFIAIMFSLQDINAQCIGTFEQDGPFTVPPGGYVDFPMDYYHAPQYIGSYSRFNLTAGNKYTFTENYLIYSTGYGANGWLVLTDDQNNFIMEGAGPLDYVPTSNQVVRMHKFTNNSCGTNDGSTGAWHHFTIYATACVGVASTTNATCAQIHDGAATVTASGSTGVNTYLWSPSGGTDSVATALAPGNYTVTVTNVCNTTLTVPVVVGNNAPRASITAASDTNICTSPVNLTASINTSRFVNNVIGFSSQYNTTNFSANQMIGAPDVFGQIAYGSNPNTWAPTYNNPQVRQFLVLGFSNPSPINTIDIYETYHPGWIDTVYVKNPGTGNFDVVYTNSNLGAPATERKLHITFPLTSYNVSEIRIAINPGAGVDYTEIDAVEIGGPIALSGATYHWSTNATTASITAGLGTYTVTINTSNGCTSKISTPLHIVQKTFPALLVKPTTDTIVCALTPAHLKILGNQRFATSVVGFSSEYSSGAYSAQSATGAPDAGPYAGVYGEAWAPNYSDFSSRNFIVLGFSNPAPIDYIDIYEMYNAGSIDTVYVKNPGTGLFEVVYSATAVLMPGAANKLHISFPLTSFNVSQVRITSNGAVVNDWINIDAVEIGGAPVITSPTYLWSNNANTPTVNVGAGNYSAQITDVAGCVYHTNIQHITAKTFPKSSITVTGDSVACGAFTSTLSCAFPFSPVVTYSWSNGSTVDTVHVGVGTYTVNATDTLGCIHQSNPQVIAQKIGVSSVIASNDTICSNATVNLSVIVQDRRWVSALDFSTPGYSLTAVEGPKDDDYWQGYGVNVIPAPDQSQYLELSFNNPAPISMIDVFETYQVSFLDSVYIKNPNTGNWVLVFTKAPAYTYNPGPDGYNRMHTHITFPLTTFNVSQVKVHGTVNSQYRFFTLDAVQIGADFNWPGSTYSWNTGATSQAITGGVGNYAATLMAPDGCVYNSPVQHIVETPHYANLDIAGDTLFCSGQTINEYIKVSTAPFSPVEKWAVSVSGMSAQQNPGDSLEILGVPDIYPTHIAGTNTWQGPDPQNDREWISLKYSNSSPIAGVNFYETNSAGMVDSVFVKNPADSSWVLVYSTSTFSPSDVQLQHITFPETAFNVNEIRFSVDGTSLADYHPMSFDAVSIIVLSDPSWTTPFTWSNSTVADSILVTTPGTFTVSATNTNGCLVTSDPFHVDFSQPATVSTPNGSNICGGAGVQLNSTSSPAYLWSNGATTQNITITSAGNYSVVTGVCNDTSNIVVVGSYANPVATVTPQTSTNLCSGGNLLLNCSAASSYNWSNGVTTQSATINAAGNYYAVVTDVHGCKDTSNMVHINGISGNLSVISGMVYKNAVPVTVGTIALLKKLPVGGVATPPAAVRTITTGAYSFNNVAPGDYVMLYSCGIGAACGTSPTYFGNKTQYQQATVLTISCADTMSSKNINAIVIPARPHGLGSISGYITEGGTNKTNAQGDPVPGVDVSLEQNPGSVMYAYTQTDSTGYFQFDSLVLGTYAVIADVPGYGYDTSANYTLTSGNPNVTMIICSDSTQLQMGTCMVTYVAGASATESIVGIYPNPTNDVLNISLGKQKAKITLMEITGKQIETINADSNARFSLANLASGVYLVKVQTDKEALVYRVVKQ